jgi:ABC-2 type transport system ATP-binding protein
VKDEVIVRTHGLKKHFGKVPAVDGVDLALCRGEVFGFLGPNGAGKTTTIGILLGLLRPTSGTVEVFGTPVTPARTTALARVGALVGSPGLYPYLSGRENLRLVAGVRAPVPADRLQEVLIQVGLAEPADRKVKGYSSGMKQRLGLAAALVHRPELLILDEPTNGLDPAGMRDVRGLLRDLASRGTTVFLSSHLLHEVEQVCDRAAVLNHGRIVAQGAVGELLTGERVVRARVPDPVAAGRVLASLPGAERILTNGHYVEVRGVSSESVVSHLIGNGIVPSEIGVGQADLESVFLALTQEA